MGDEVIALDAAFHGGPGILQIAGTGSNTIGRAADGSRESAGGYSSRLGDEGSGYWIGLNSVRRALHAFDREQPTHILDKVGEIWGTRSIDDLVNLGDSTPGPDFAALAPAINELAEAGDPVALAVSNGPRQTSLNSCSSCAASSAATTTSRAKCLLRGPAAWLRIWTSCAKLFSPA